MARQAVIEENVGELMGRFRDKIRLFVANVNIKYEYKASPKMFQVVKKHKFLVCAVVVVVVIAIPMGIMFSEEVISAIKNINLKRLNLRR